jgi:hypothetical protein
MSWVITGSEKTPVDPQFTSVSLLLHGNGANGSTTITDSSPTPKTVTAVGNAQISTAQSKFGGASIAFDGSGDWLTISRIALTGDFTIEFFVRLNSASNDAIIAVGDSIFYQLLRLNENGIAGKISAYIGSGYVFSSVTSGIAANTWNHVALVRSGVTFYLFVEGQQLAVNTSPGTEARGPLSLNLIGAGYTGIHALNGFIDEFRCSNVARYTANFTPPTAPFPDI